MHNTEATAQELDSIWSAPALAFDSYSFGQQIYCFYGIWRYSEIRPEYYSCVNTSGDQKISTGGWVPIPRLEVGF
jgi:hypothetical protein